MARRRTPHPSEVILERILERDEVQDIFQRAQGVVDKFAHVLDRVAAGDIPRGFRRQEGIPRGQRAAPPGVQQGPAENPRSVLGFAPGAKLTADLIKTRKRDLAKLFHPDRGGSPDAMRRVNAAADVLLKEVGAR